MNTDVLLLFEERTADIERGEMNHPLVPPSVIHRIDIDIYLAGRGKNDALITGGLGRRGFKVLPEYLLKFETHLLSGTQMPGTKKGDPN
jgi:hypothetical protein